MICSSSQWRIHVLYTIYFYIYSIHICKYVKKIYIYIWSPPPPGPTFSHPRRGRCHRDIYNKIVHSTETMEKTVKNEHLSKWKLICTESKNCCKSVLFRPKFGLESHGLKYIYGTPPKKTYLFACFFGICTYVMKKNKKPWENNKKQKQNIPGLLQKQKSKKPRENQKKQKNQKKQYSRTLAKVKMQKSKKPRENQKNQKKKYSRSLEIGSTGKSPGILFFLFFWFSRGFLDFCIFTFARVLEYCFFCFFWFSRGFLDFCFCKSPGIFVFCFLLFSQGFSSFYLFFF